LAYLYVELQEFEKAIDFQSSALRISRDTQDGTLVVDHIGRMGDIYWFSSREEQAVEYYEHALTSARQNNDPYQEAQSLSDLGHVYQIQEGNHPPK